MTKRLTDLLPPPESPIETTGDWEEVERRLGTPLPQDYKAFIEMYGTGHLCNLFYVLNPFSEHKAVELIRQCEKWQEEYTKLFQGYIDKNDPDYRFLPHPARPGLLICIYSDDGDQIYWLTEGEPEDWTIVVEQHSWGEVFYLSEYRLEDFLISLLAKTLPHDLFKEIEASFEPLELYSPVVHYDYRVEEASAAHKLYQIADCVAVRIPATWAFRTGRAGSDDFFSVDSPLMDFVNEYGEPNESSISVALCRERPGLYTLQKRVNHMRETDYIEIVSHGVLDHESLDINWIESIEHECFKRLTFVWEFEQHSYNLECCGDAPLIDRTYDELMDIARSIRIR
ncbi:MAG: SMI1/KNR4 family protein [Planctomycetota bacterium]|nr:MAG: SMI1/KNR4 family protein [Planctomycetota bacterium]REK29819.1 MAG: SMI1/KNR4 family protein [Planctomycetota bacterium]REK48010.1 MAG: SMI1/KNR4 family protein [Planctomycetota bacterium]